jgi:hypothetical protein
MGVSSLISQGLGGQSMGGALTNSLLTQQQRSPGTPGGPGQSNQNSNDPLTELLRNHFFGPKPQPDAIQKDPGNAKTMNFPQSGFEE